VITCSPRGEPQSNVLWRPDIAAAYAVRLLVVAGDDAILVDVGGLRACGLWRIECEIPAVGLSQERVEGIGIVQRPVLSCPRLMARTPVDFAPGTSSVVTPFSTRTERIAFGSALDLGRQIEDLSPYRW